MLQNVRFKLHFFSEIWIYVKSLHHFLYVRVLKDCENRVKDTITVNFKKKTGAAFQGYEKSTFVQILPL